MDSNTHQVGTSAYYQIGKLTFIVEILDNRRAFNRHEVLIKPAYQGNGTKWVTAEKVKPVQGGLC
jgi:hypothetical protein